jgi:hypothetical protein
MTTFYVATLARWVLVEANSPVEAINEAMAKLRQEQPDAVVRTVRPATKEEIELQEWHDEHLKNG